MIDVLSQGTILFLVLIIMSGLLIILLRIDGLAHQSRFSKMALVGCILCTMGKMLIDSRGIESGDLIVHDKSGKLWGVGVRVGED